MHIYDICSVPGVSTLIDNRATTVDCMATSFHPYSQP